MATESRAEGGVTDELPKGRLEAFADGVLAIVITLLVLELEVPGRETQDDLASALLDEWRGYTAYLISFVFAEPLVQVRRRRHAR
jgi:uncharacterized membrane protein